MSPILRIILLIGFGEVNSVKSTIEINDGPLEIIKMYCLVSSGIQGLFLHTIKYTFNDKIKPLRADDVDVELESNLIIDFVPLEY